MNDHLDGSELPDLSNDDIRLLYNICHRARESPDPPFKALFNAYDAILKEEDLQQEHDGVIFRALLRVGESTVEANKKREHVDLVERLEHLLDERGIVLQHVDDQDEYTGNDALQRRPSRNGRRVSFDDARLEETWLSQHSDALSPVGTQSRHPNDLLRAPPRRARHADTGRRARSTSSQRSVVRHPAPKVFRTSSSQDRYSDDDETQNPTLHFELSQTQLEINADAMLATSELRLQRRALHFLHDQSLQLKAAHDRSADIAVAHDRRILLKQALETWRGAVVEQRAQRHHEEHFQHLEHRAQRARDLFLMTKAFTHWAVQCQYHSLGTRVGQHHMLRFRYFRRWRRIAVDNQAKERRILCRKFLAVWRDKTARRALSEQHAEAWHEDRLVRRCNREMFWEYCSRLVVPNADNWVKKRAWSKLINSYRQRRETNVQAQQLRDGRRVQRAMAQIGVQQERRQRDDRAANQHYIQTISSKSINELKIHVKLGPLARTVHMKVNMDLMRKALAIWRRNLEMHVQASVVRRRMLLLSCSTNLQDEYRCRKFRASHDERAQIESLHLLQLEHRLRIHQRESNYALAQRILDKWRARVSEERNQIEYVQAVFAESQHRRRLRSGIVCLNLAKRRRENARRAAIEFRNSRDLPPTLVCMREQHEHLQRLESWAQMALFYRLGSRTLRVWNERTTEQKANRRRNAYAHVRARIKIRVVGECFKRLRDRTAQLRSMDDEAERRANGHLEGAKAGALVKWRDSTGKVAELEVQATTIDHERLLRSALGALLTQSSEKAALHERLQQSTRATELAALAFGWRRLTWQMFRFSRNYESAEALELRNRDTHAKQMFRHWAVRTAARRLPAQPPVEGQQEIHEPESPSLRPASRAASRASASNTPAALPPSSPPHRQEGPDSTPGYMRTPSRSRRAGRFRPLPTPAAMTPFAFEPGYLATTPAPLTSGRRQAEAADPGAGVDDGLTPQVTPFERKLRAGGFGTGGRGMMPASALRSSVLGGVGGASAAGGTGKSVRFAGSGGRFGRLKNS